MENEELIKQLKTLIVKLKMVIQEVKNLKALFPNEKKTQIKDRWGLTPSPYHPSKTPKVVKHPPFKPISKDEY